MHFIVSSYFLIKIEIDIFHEIQNRNKTAPFSISGQPTSVRVALEQGGRKPEGTELSMGGDRGSAFSHPSFNRHFLSTYYVLETGEVQGTGDWGGARELRGEQDRTNRCPHMLTFCWDGLAKQGRVTQ